MRVKPILLTKKLETFVYRRSGRWVNHYQSLRVIAAHAYIQGMNDVVDALASKKEETK